MTTTELIATLRGIEEKHGILPVYLEANATGINLMDEGGNVFESYTINPVAQKCEVHGTEDGAKVVWLMGSVAGDIDDEDVDDEL
jgi:hypothetical protein